MNNSAKVFTQISDFLDYLGADVALDIQKTTALAGLDLNPKFPFLCSKHYADLIKKAPHKIPLLLQVLSTQKELEEIEGFVEDPVGDLPAGKSECIIQKYKNRALVVTTATCSVRCRFCFRKNYPFKETENLAQKVSEWLSTHNDIWEIILSGGDPLMLPPEKLAELACEIAKYKFVNTLRIHTRLPIMRPDLVVNHIKLLADLPKRFNCVMVLHVNHSEELGESTWQIFSQLKTLGWTLLSQSVLLKGVNDSGIELENLFKKLFNQGVLPYYLHQLDHAKGVAHFEISDEHALQLLDEIRGSLPGYLVPRLVREIQGEKSKTPIF